MAGPDLLRPFHGVRLPAPLVSPAEPMDSLVSVCRAFAKRMPEHWFFSHTTAAQLWGVPLPGDPDPRAPLDVAALAPRKGPSCAGAVGHRISDSATSVELRHGLPTADIVSVWLQLASVLALDDLVAAGDHLIRAFDSRRGAVFASHSTPGEIGERMLSWRGNGKPAALRAFPMLRIGAESRRETLLRLAILRAGLPEPRLNQRVHSTHGRFIGRVDLEYPEWNVVVEYDGEHHRTDDRQYAIDLDRLDALRHSGRTVVVIRKGHMVERAAPAAARVARALRDAGWRP